MQMSPSLVGAHTTLPIYLLTHHGRTLALVAWEFFITIQHEVSIGWQAKPTATSIMFIVNRWVMLCMSAVHVAAYWAPVHGIAVGRPFFVHSQMLSRDEFGLSGVGVSSPRFFMSELLTRDA